MRPPNRPDLNSVDYTAYYIEKLYTVYLKLYKPKLSKSAKIKMFIKL